MSAGGSRLPLVVVGCDFRVAPSAARSRLVLGETGAAELTAALRSLGAGDGLVVLETCNRSEWIATTTNPSWAAALLKAKMLSLLGDAPRSRDPYTFEAEAAARHVLRVTLGLESLVAGERQIAGQVRRAFATARERGHSGRVLNGLATAAGRVVRLADRARVGARVGRGVHTLAADHVDAALAGRAGAAVLVVGLGAVGRKVAATLRARTRYAVVACTRSAAPGSGARPLAELPALIAAADATVVCTAASAPVVDAAMLAAARPGAVVLDLGIPEQVARADAPPHVLLAGLDELAAGYAARDGRGAAASAALARAIDETIGEFAWFCSVPDYAGVLEALIHRGKPALYDGIGRALARLHDAVPQHERVELEREVRGVVQGYTNGILASLKAASLVRLEET
jgi:glutamyl-tRNA reductase